MTVFLVRHAQAGRRSDFDGGDDSLRPLTTEGRHQAAALAGLLAELGATTVYSSPYRRCVQTAAPLAALLGVAVVETSALEEGPPDAAIELTRRVAAESAAFFSHGDIIPAILDDIVAHDVVDLGTEPRCQKGSVWILEPDKDSPGVFASATYLPPPRWMML
jgi:8-oxo-(d)GTP phosphatase